MIIEIGIKLSLSEQVAKYEHQVYNQLKQQIENNFANEHNLIVNLTWFGPHFNNGEYEKLLKFLDSGVKVDRLFWFGLVDPLTVLPEFLEKVEQKLLPKEKYYVGYAFQGPHTFHLPSIFLLEDMPKYKEEDILMSDLQYIFLCYNRKPKPHRIQLVEKLYESGLEKYGILTLGKQDVHYDVSEGLITEKFFKLENDDPSLYTKQGTFFPSNKFGGIPYDCLSLGRIDIWQKHFLNIVSETEYRPWDTVFPTEKILKPLIGLRPFVINGQTTEYQWLRDQGFKTFNEYFNGIELENIPETEVQDSIVKVIQYLVSLDKKQLIDMYNEMLPTLKHNRARWFEFAKEQQNKVTHLFDLTC